MKVIVDIPNWLYNAIMECKEPHYSKSLGDAVRDGTPLPEHHGDLVDRNELLKQYGLENATKYGNKDAEQQKHSYSTMMMYEIADMIEDAETIIPATKEKSCKNCKYKCFREAYSCVETPCNACYEASHFATKEGDGE